MILAITFIFSCSHELEYDVPPSSKDDGMPSFSSDEARAFFEDNATDLASLFFSKERETKSSTISDIELIPEWGKAMESGHGGVHLFEIPIQSDAVNLFVVKQFKNDTNVSNKHFISQRRLIIARRSNGEAEMFIATVVPSEEFMNKAYKSLENFRYFGGGDFTGWITNNHQSKYNVNCK